METSLKLELEERRKWLASKLNSFLAVGKTENWKIAKEISEMSKDSLEKLEGNELNDDPFTHFVDILYEVQQLEDFGNSPFPREKDVREWVLFLEKFSLRKY